MRAFHSDASIKNYYLTRVRQHRAADELAHGIYYARDLSTGRMRMCAVGCTIHGRDHSAYERELGIPQSLACLEDRFFEGMPEADSQEWPARFLESIPVGADLSLVTASMMLWLFDEQGYNVGQYARPDGKLAIEGVAHLYRRVLVGENAPISKWQEARRVAAIASTNASINAAIYTGFHAAEAAEAATYPVFDTTDAHKYTYTIADAADASADAATYAAYAATADADDATDAAKAGARERAYSRMADELVMLLGAAPVAELGLT